MSSAAPAGAPAYGWRLASVHGVPVYIGRSWPVIAVVIIISFGPQVSHPTDPSAPGWFGYAVAAAYALLLLVSVLTHEAAHAVVARRFRYRVDRVVADLWGGHTVYDSSTSRPGASATIAVAGPVANLALAGVGHLLQGVVADPVAGLLVGALTFTNLFVGVFNLLPGLPLDGGFVVDALVWRVTGDRSKGLLVAGWLGRALTVLVLFWIVVRPLLAGQTPSLFTIVWGGLIGAFLWSGATNAIKSATARRLISSVTVGQVLRPVLTVAATESAQGVLDRLGRDPQVGFVVAVDGSGSPAGLVDVPAIGGIDEVRRPLVAAASLVLRQPDGWLVAAGPDDDVGSVINAIATHPQSDGSQLQVVLVTDPVGRILGTVAVDDLNRAFPR